MTEAVGPFGPFVLDHLVWEPDAEPGGRISLRGSRCGACGRVELPALSSCPADGGAVTDVRLGPDATLAGFTEVLHPPPGAEVDVPYTLAVASFAEAGLSVLGRLDTHAPVDALTIGDPVEVVMGTYRNGRTYVFRSTASPPAWTSSCD